MCVSICTFVLVNQANCVPMAISIRLTGKCCSDRFCSACIRQHTSAYVGRAYVSIRQHTSESAAPTAAVQPATVATHTHAHTHGRIRKRAHTMQDRELINHTPTYYKGHMLVCACVSVETAYATHTCACVRVETAYVSIRQHTSAYMCVYVRVETAPTNSATNQPVYACTLLY